ncbi:MAG: polysaccharide biosynthesis C-terminal domain-containing protein [Bacteroidales bacterium]|nr:polysaccharide biosynthesis C-terminal domain-containing protein [Bacteroidales bacterium]
MEGIIRKNSLWATVINYVGVAVGFLSAIIFFPRLLSIEELGLTNVLLNASTLLAQIAALGASNIALRFFPFFKTGERQYNGIFTIAFLISLVGIILVSALFFIFKSEIINYYKTESPLFAQYFMLLFPMMVFILFYSLFSSWLRSLKKIIASAVYIEIILRAAALLSVLIYATGMISFEVFILLYVGSYAVPAIGLLIHCGCSGMLGLKIKITDQMRTYYKPAILYGFFCLFATIGASMVVNIDTIMLAGKVGLVEVGIYSIAIRFMSMLQMPYRAMLSISGPIVAEYWRDNNMEKMGELYKKFSLNISIITLIIFLVVWVNIDSFYIILPDGYDAGKWAILILFIGKFVDISSGLNSTILNTSEKYKWDLYLSIFLIISAIITNMIFIPIWGIEGAAFATTLSVLLLNVARVWLVKHFFHIQPFTLNVALVLLMTIAAGAIISFVPVFMFWIWDVAFRSILVALLFLLPVYLLKLSKEFNDMIDHIFKAIFGRIRRK